MRFANEYGYCELNPFPGCNQIVISNHGVVFKEHRGQGHGQANHQLRVERAIDMGYDLMLCTVKADNAAEIHILNSHGWTRLDTFLNSESGSIICLFSKHIHRELVKMGPLTMRQLRSIMVAFTKEIKGVAVGDNVVPFERPSNV